MDRKAMSSLFEGFDDLKVLVAGDVMLDAYIYGEVKRISPEAPIPVVNVTEKSNCLGGAANVALNVKALGATVDLYSVIGADAASDVLVEAMGTHDLWAHGMIRSSDRRTTVKSRIISGSQHIVRFDEEDLFDLNETESGLLLEAIGSKITEYDVMIMEDYDKGCLTPAVISELIRLANKHDVMTAVDPKKAHFMDYMGVTLFKPNLQELAEGLQMAIGPDDLKKGATLLQQKLDYRNLLVTLSQHGVFYQDATSQGSIPAHVRNIANVSGAGDTVIAVAALCIASGMDIHETAVLANLAGGIVCESAGIVPIDKDRLFREALGVRE